MKLFAFLIVLFAIFCAAFARYEIPQADHGALTLTAGGSRGSAASRGLKDTYEGITTSLDDGSDNENESGGADETDTEQPDTENDFEDDTQLIDGEDDNE